MARATSIISTSGAGASLEARIAATFLAAVLAESSGPGDDPSAVAERIDFQRNDPVAGFDDLHLHHRTSTGGRAATYLQIKRTLTGTRSEEAFKRPVTDAARLLSAGGADEARFRIVASQSAISARDVDRARDAARLSVDSTDFWSGWQAAGKSSETERNYTSSVEWVVEQDLKRADADLAWRVIARLAITMVDADQTGSHAIARAIDQLQTALVSGDRGEAQNLFDSLSQFAEDAAKVAGGVDRPKLIAEFAPRYRLAAGPAARACIERVAADAGAALASIREDIGGVRLPRSALIDQLVQAMDGVRSLKLGGDAGSGKSAALRTLAERQREAGAGLILLKFDRLTARTWAELATTLQITTPLPQLIAELAAGGSGLLVIDGLDRMLDAGFGGLIGEICAAIHASPSADLWRCLVSARDTAGPEPILQYPLLDELRSWSVGAPARDDLAVLAQAFPHLSPLIARRGYAELNRNLFFIDQMAQKPSLAGASSELDLMRAWAGRGAAETPRHPTRDATLRALGEARLGRPYAPLPKPADDAGLTLLASERTIVIPPYRDVVTFGHDIYEDWAVARSLDARRGETPEILLAVGQPLAWMRAIRLVSEIAVEADGADGWLAFHDLLRAQALDPLWRRLALTSVLHSPRAGNLLDILAPTLLDHDGKLMADLVETLQTLELRPHPVILQSPQFDHLDPAERRKTAQDVAIPRLAPWHAFLSWSVEKWGSWPKALVPPLARATLVWLRVRDADRALTSAMILQCIEWLRELDAINAMPFSDWEERSRLLKEMGADRSGSADPVRDMLREVMAWGAAEAKDAVDAYLVDLLAAGARGGEALVESPGVIPTILPGRFVDLVIATMIMRYDLDAPLDYAVEQSDGIQDHGRFFPASPTRAGADQLFAADEDEALRLFDALGAAAAAVWRRRRARKGETARPLRIAMGGVQAELWGDEHAYKWVTGLLGPRLLGSLYLAASDWIAAQLEEGRSVEELCAKLLGASHLVASASLCLSAAKMRASAVESLREALPLILAPRLWSYDLRLALEDRTGGGFGMGWNRGDDTAYQAALAVRQRRLAQTELVEALIAPLHLLGDAELKDAFAQGVAAWRVEDLASTDEELANEQALAGLEADLDNQRAKADPANWNLRPGPAENSFSLTYAAPEPIAERFAEAIERHEAIEESGALMEWAFGKGTSGTIPKGQTFIEALPIAKAMDEPGMFEHALDLDLVYSMKCRGVAAVAAAVATHGDAELIAQELAWLDSVFVRAAAIDHASDPLYYEETQLSDDAAAFAARGLGALAMRGMATAEQKRIWLGLIATPFREIAAAALEPACAFSRVRPSAAAAAFSVSATSMLYAWQPYDMDFEAKMKAYRAERDLQTIDAALLSMASGQVERPQFPLPATEPFIGGDASNPCAGDPEFQFDHYRAATVWKPLDIEQLAASEDLRDLLVEYFSGALGWYSAFLDFQTSEHGWGLPSRAMHWESALGRITGWLVLAIDPSAAIARLIEPAAAVADGKARSDILASQLDVLGRALYDNDLPLDARFEAVWRAAAQPLLEQGRQDASRRHDPQYAPLSAAAFAYYNYPVFPGGWPRAGELGGLLTYWVGECARYRFAASLIRTLIKQAGPAFIPAPGLGWLEAIVDAHRSTSADDWRTQIGPAAGDILSMLWNGSSADDRRSNVVRFRAAAARLADHGVASAASLLPEIAIVQAGA